jgi:hypothetical protein
MTCSLILSKSLSSHAEGSSVLSPSSTGLSTAIQPLLLEDQTTEELAAATVLKLDYIHYSDLLH